MSRRPPSKSKTPRGRVPGVPQETTQARRQANRTRGWKHGQRALAVSLVDVRAAQIEKVQKGASAVVQAYKRAIVDGDLEKHAELAVMAMSETELLRRDTVDKINEKGVMVEDDLVSSDGRVIGARFKANPLLEHVHRFNETLGFTAADLLLTPKHRGDLAVNAALAAAQLRDAKLRSLPKDRVPPPASEE
jgi:hypothetical protein